jgi:Protein of unknown function (DUF2628)
VIDKAMTKFIIYKHPDGRLSAVKEGFSIPGAIFGGFWLWWHKMWLLGSVALAIGIGLYFVFPSPEGYILGIPYGHRLGIADFLNVVICVIVGIFGNEWRRNSLIERGFDKVSSEMATTEDGAKAQYLRGSNQVAATGTLDERKEPYF